jgi:hypothetical protein
MFLIFMAAMYKLNQMSLPAKYMKNFASIALYIWGGGTV